MKCYNCGAQLSEHNFCTNCMVDVVMYKKIVRTSNFFYNQGLEKAKVRDLSGAIVALKQSLKFNKGNIKARNLLGLVYFETGEVTAALSEWVISTNLQGKRNVAADYIERVQSNQVKLNQLNESIKKYNSALQSCLTSDGEDMAAIQLRAMLAKNPNFLRARQLLALCLIKQNKLESARKELEICRSIDVNNTRTLNYLREINLKITPEAGGKKKKQVADGEFSETYVADNELIIQPKGVKERKGSNTVLNIIVGVGIGLAISLFLILPARIQSERAEAQETVKNIGVQLDAKNLKITELEQKISDLEEKTRSLNETLNAYSGTEGTLLSMESLLKAAYLYLNDPSDVQNVADYITAIDESAWTEETSENYKNLYYALKNAIGPKVCDLYYQEGKKAFNNKQYEDAIAYLESAVFFDSTDGDALYLLATSYRAAEQPDNVKTSCNKILELFPGSWYAGRAEQYLKEIQ